MIHTPSVDCIVVQCFRLAESGKFVELATDHMVTDHLGEQIGDSHSGANETIPHSYFPVLLAFTQSLLFFLPSIFPSTRKMTGMVGRALDRVLQWLLPSLFPTDIVPQETCTDSVSLRVLKPASFTC